MSDLSPRIERGAKLLDERVPGWESRIDLEALDLSVGCDCVLGQVFGDYDVSLGTLDGHAATRPVSFGFIAQGNESYESLTAKWRAFIARRRGQGRAA